MAYDNNRFCWHGIISTAPETTTPFYETVLGWQAQTVAMGDEDGILFAASDGVTRAHTMAPPMEGVPSHWSSYFRVEDVDASAEAAVANGGTLIVPGTDIPPGRFATVASPSGAVFQLFHESDPTAANPGDADGAIHWVELHSTSLEADLAWLKATFGIDTQTMDMPEGPYHVLVSGETQVGGAMTQANEGAPSMWLPWVRQDDVDGAIARASENGGSVIAPAWEVPNVGRLSVLSDPAQGVFGVIRPAAR